MLARVGRISGWLAGILFRRATLEPYTSAISTTTPNNTARWVYDMQHLLRTLKRQNSTIVLMALLKYKARGGYPVRRGVKK
jgi:hypothetical protein